MNTEPAIRLAAYYHWLRRGRPMGDDWTDWFAAKRELYADGGGELPWLTGDQGYQYASDPRFGPTLYMSVAAETRYTKPTASATDAPFWIGVSITFLTSAPAMLMGLVPDEFRFSIYLKMPRGSRFVAPVSYYGECAEVDGWTADRPQTWPAWTCTPQRELGSWQVPPPTPKPTGSLLPNAWCLKRGRKLNFAVQVQALPANTNEECIGLVVQSLVAVKAELEVVGDQIQLLPCQHGFCVRCQQLREVDQQHHCAYCGSSFVIMALTPGEVNVSIPVTT